MMDLHKRRDHIKFLQNMADYHNARKTSKGYRQFHAEEWDKYTKHWDLSEEFIERFYDKVNWRNVSKYQILSEKFILTWKHLLDIDIVIACQKISPEIIEMLKG